VATAIAGLELHSYALIAFDARYEHL
jgi:hypothetical protein